MNFKTAGGILETAIYVDDIDAAEAFYTEVFGLETVTKLDGKFVFLRCGQGMLLIFNPKESSTPNANNPIPRHGTTGAGHFCFSAKDAEEVGKWRDHFVSLGIEIERYHIWDGSGAHSVYIRDPGNNSVEVGELKIWGFE